MLCVLVFACVRVCVFINHRFAREFFTVEEYRKILLVAHRSSLLEIGKLKHYKKEILVIMIAQLHCIEISEPGKQT